MSDGQGGSEQNIRVKDFPPGFRWGCATSSYQIEGAAAEEGRGESIWDRFCRTPGNVRDGSSGDVACDHFHHWAGDLDLARGLGINSYRFSISWPRVLPTGSVRHSNDRGLAFYDRLVDGMLERGLEPWATLYHWDLPQSLQDLGGWRNRATADAFADYAGFMAKTLGDRVRHWITHNEPWCSAFLGHLEGIHAPGLRSTRAAFQACHHILLSHGLAVPAIRAEVGDARVGIVLSLHPLRAASAAPEDVLAVRRHDGLRNRWFLDPLYGRGYPVDVWSRLDANRPDVMPQDFDIIAAPTDFLGVNYYFPETVYHCPGGSPVETAVSTPVGAEVTAFGWEVEPAGLVELLVRVYRDYAPPSMLLTENGATYEDVVDADGAVHDEQRQRFLQRHVGALRSALAAGVPLGGYFVWSLLDNFEWAEGYSRRFGLVHVDFATQRRRLKDSACWYRDFLAGRAPAALP